MKISALNHPTARLVYLPLLALLSIPAAASPLDDAKRAGLVGEASSGYIAIINPAVTSSTIRQLADEVNLKRKAKYREIADRHQTSLQAIEGAAGKKLTKRAENSGHYYQNDSGDWTH